MNTLFNEEQFEAILAELAASGIITSFCFGPCCNGSILWSVTCRAPSGEVFDESYVANNLMHCAEIARVKCIQRGWMK